MKWRRANTEAFGVSDTWLYSDANPEGMTVLDRDTGADAGHLPRDMFPGRLYADTLVLAFADRWLFSFGPVAAPDAAAMGDARGCLQITGCDADPRPPPVPRSRSTARPPRPITAAASRCVHNSA